jgi:hypothetical protein
MPQPDDKAKRSLPIPAKGASHGRKPYTAPVLKEFGAVSKLTQGVGTHGSDGGPQTKN